MSEGRRLIGGEQARQIERLVAPRPSQPELPSIKERHRLSHQVELVREKSVEVPKKKDKVIFEWMVKESVVRGRREILEESEVVALPLSHRLSHKVEVKKEELELELEISDFWEGGSQVKEGGGQSSRVFEEVRKSRFRGL